jgi:hypothetical protein
MKKILLICAVTALTGCAMVWTRPGGTQAEFNQESYQCQQEAAASFPAAIVANTSAGYRTPSQTTCNTYGNTTNCSTQPGVQYVQPTTTTSDANAMNRAGAYRSCMYAHGWQLGPQQR